MDLLFFKVLAEGALLELNWASSSVSVQKCHFNSVTQNTKNFRKIVVYKPLIVQKKGGWYRKNDTDDMILRMGTITKQF